jgi:hypothetical protein
MKKKFTLAVVVVFAALKISAQCASCTIPFVNSSQAVGTSTGVVIPLPSGISAGDLMIAAVHVGWCNSGSTVTAPGGWTQIAQLGNTGSGCGSSNTTKQLATFYKIATASEPSTFTFLGTSNQYYVGGIAVYSGVNTANPINTGTSFGAQGSCTAIVANSATTTVSCTRLVNVFFCSVNSSKTNIVPQPSLTERFDIGTTGNHPWGNENLELSDELFTGVGATGIRTASLSTCSGTGWVTGAQMIALECALSTGIKNDRLSGLEFISPNPSTGIFAITLTEDPKNSVEIHVLDCLGRTVKTLNTGEKRSELDLSAQPKGIYFLKLFLPNGTVTKKIIIQ